MTQTAVDWLVNELPQVDWSDPYWKLKLEQAKAMEKQQMIDSTVQFLIKHLGVHSEQSILKAVELLEQYYNETYGE
jgi:hypothetical protein